MITLSAYFVFGVEAHKIERRTGARAAPGTSVLPPRSATAQPGLSPGLAERQPGLSPGSARTQRGLSAG